MADSEKNDLFESIDPNDKIEILVENEEDDDDSDDKIDSKKLSKLISNIKSEKKKGAEYEEGDFYYIIWKIAELTDKIKLISKDINDKSSELIVKTENKIKSLTDKECEDLLYKKWCEPFMESLKNCIYEPINQFIEKNEYLANKYKTTFNDLEYDIENNSVELKKLLSELEGNEYDIKGINDLIKIL